MHVFLPAEDSESELRAELAATGAAVETSQPGGLLTAEFAASSEPALPCLAFARQVWLEAQPLRGESIRIWSDRLLQAVIDKVPEDEPWRLQVTPHYGSDQKHRMGARAWHSLTRRQGTIKKPGFSPGQGVQSDAGRNRATLIRQVFLDDLRKHRRHLLKHLADEPQPFAPSDSVVQLVLTSPDQGFLSVCSAPGPFRHRHVLSPFPNGNIPPAQDKLAPSRAFAKLVEAEQRLGRSIQLGETCVDLGAAPGSWTYVAVKRGARVTAVDRAPLRPDLERQVKCEKADAFSWAPPGTVDWLLCDVISAPERSADLLLSWLKQGWCRHFVVTLKSGDTVAPGFFQDVAARFAGFCRELRLTRLCANKKEVCVYGSAAV